ncbi:putative quinol monooxygenase [Paenisporosarcina cavernae]|uniref:Antibiotic biosynthesis monooxygenase n=1 Tax=Paenisporosarcina cavernae TaxID=2320858 RepID=A0A385YYS2_9BACL|nr:putative quinol monooxygenase [Paenisporosarcina cavernae]AYC30502.1 antibiotic biosynthesis monooxygenase [Paenisporosarcina cavernae]
MFSLFGKFVAAEGKKEELQSVLLNAANSMQEVPTCLQYTIHINEEEPLAIYVFEVWESEVAHHDSLELDATKALIQQAMPLIAGMDRISKLQAVGGKGL